MARHLFIYSFIQQVFLELSFQSADVKTQASPCFHGIWELRKLFFLLGRLKGKQAVNSTGQEGYERQVQGANGAKKEHLTHSGGRAGRMYQERLHGGSDVLAET